MAEPAHQQAQAYTAEGQPIAPEDTAAAVREGRGFFQRGAKVYARNPEGALVTVAPEDATLPGYQVLSQPELKAGLLKRDAESLSGMAKTAGEGAIRGATMGLLGPEQFYDSEGRARAKARVEANPNLAAGSELAGMTGATLAASALSGGAASGGAGARLAALAGRSALTPFRAAAVLGEAAEGGAAALGAGQGILGTAARLGARGLAEGALYGAGHEVSQAALEDVPLTAERLLAGAWDGAKMGGAFGAGLGVLGAGVGKAGRAIIGRMAESGDDLGKATGTWAERAMFKQQVGNQGKFFDKATRFGADPAGPGRIGRKLLDADMPTETTAALRRADELVNEAALRLKQVAAAADETGVMSDPGQILAAVDDQIAKLKEVPFGDFQNIAARIEKQIAPFRTKVQAAERAAVSPEEAAAFLKQQPGYKALDDFLGGDHVKASRYWNDGGFEGVVKRSGKEAASKLKRFFDDVNDAIAKAGESGIVAPGKVFSGRRWTQQKIDDFLRNPKNGIWSTSRSEKQAHDFAFGNLYGDYKPVLLEIEQRSGVPVSGLQGKALQAEEEVLLGANRKWEVVGHSVQDSADGPITRIQIREAGPPPTPLSFSELWSLRKSLDETINWEAKQQKPAKEALTEMRDAFRAELDNALSRAADGGSPELLRAWKQATEDYGDFALTRDGLKGLIKQRGKNRNFSLTDYGTGGAAGMLMGVLSGSPVTGMAASAVTSAAHKLIRERGAGVLAKIADRTGGVAGRMELAGKVAALVEAPKRLATPTAVNVSQAFDTYSKALSQAQSEPAKFAEKLATATADLGLRAPELAQQVQQVMLADMAYLNDLHPQPATRKNNTITPMAKLPEFYAFNQKKAFVDAAVAIDNPVSIFEDIARGELPLDGIKALKARRPLLFGEMRTTVIKYTAQRTEELPFNRRMLLGSAFDFPADWSILHVGEIQESLMASNDPKSKNDPTAAPSKLNTDPGAAMTPGQF